MAMLAGMVAALAGCGSDKSDGTRSFLVRDASGALFVEWERVGDDVSGSMSATNITQPQSGLFSGARDPSGTVQQQTMAFTGTVQGDSVRLLVGSGSLASRFNGRLEGDTLELKVPQDNGIQTLRLKPADRDDYDKATRALRAGK